MSKLPTVAIIGRPNTGKSTLFNRLVGSRRAIVSPVPGTTRDPVAQCVEGEKLAYLLMDTGGMGGGTEDVDFEEDVHAQSLLALEHSDLILFVVNGREELTAADHEVATLLRTKRRKHVAVFLVIARCDDRRYVDEALPRFYELGIADEIYPVSAIHTLGINELSTGIEEKLLSLHFGGKEEEEEKPMPKIALVGKPNVGKSSLVNALMSDPQRKLQGRMVSPVPGTTRDTTDTIITHKEKKFLFLDTAGLQHRKYKAGEVEIFAMLRTLQAIEVADVTVLVLDADQKISRQDKRIASMTIERGSGLIILVNKSDLLDEEKKKTFSKEIQLDFPFCRWAPIIFTSAETRENLPKLFLLISTVAENRSRRIETSVLNRWYQDTVAKYQPKGIGGLGAKTKYVTQVESRPPTFVIFLHNPKRLHFSSLRFLENKLRESYSLEGTPVRWVKKGREE